MIVEFCFNMSGVNVKKDLRLVGIINDEEEMDLVRLDNDNILVFEDMDAGVYTH